MQRLSASSFDRLLAPVHHWIWRNPERRVQKLLRFGETETDGGRDLLRAAELTRDPLLRRLYLLHAVDEQRHGTLFRGRAAAMLASGDPECGGHAAAMTAAAGPPHSAHGLDDLDVARESDETMLAFLHVAERSAASRFAVYRDVLRADPATQRVFDDILHDEKFHMNYTLTQLVRVSPERHRAKLWRARLTRLWNAYLRVASALAGVLGGAFLTAQYFVVLPLFALLSKRAAAREPLGWRPIAPRDFDSMRSQY
ncbi:MAG TPA: ferritin-like domain-containing protein [Thermoanaerobaculia bacterium]